MITAEVAPGRCRGALVVIACPAMLVRAMSLNRPPGATVGAALMLVVGEVAATSLTVGAAAVQLGGTLNPPIEAARPKPAVTGVPPPHTFHPRPVARQKSPTLTPRAQ